MSDPLSRLENWFRQQCDGEWEHERGIKIETLDNPGWSVAVDLTGTPLSDATFQPINVERNDVNWIRCRMQGQTFEGYGGPANLNEILDVFLNWADTA